jgi:hypothetical protein
VCEEQLSQRQSAPHWQPVPQLQVAGAAAIWQPHAQPVPGHELQAQAF